MSKNNVQHNKTRPTKKQKLLLDYITDFINQHGYSPSYREIKTGLNYNSVATVALHINSLVARGHLIKRDHSARSLEPVNQSNQKIKTNPISADEEKWLVEKVEYFFKLTEQQRLPEKSQTDQLYVLIGALKVLGLDGAVNSFLPRLSVLSAKLREG